MLALSCLVFNWVEMCEGKRALIWNLFFAYLDYEMHKGTKHRWSFEKVTDIWVFTWVAQD